MKTIKGAPKVWRVIVPDLIQRLGVDWRNARILAHPWSRAAHSMVQGWRIRLSRPLAKGNARVTDRPTWQSFARLAVGIVAKMANRARQGDWHRWAKNRVSGGSRYIPKKDRPR